MANLSNINNKFIVTDGGQALVNQTVAGFNPDADDLIVGNLSGNTGITIASGPNAGNYGSIYFADGAGSSTPSKAGYIRYEQNTSKMTIGINAVEKVAIDLNGNVGIGEANPSWQLEVSDTGTVRAAVTSTNNNTAGVFFRVFNSGTQVGNGTIATQNNGDMKFFTGTSSEAERMRIESNGNLLLKGTGVTSLLKFDSSAYGQIVSTSNILYYDIDTQVFRNSAGTSENMRIDSSGNVGIGTASPTANYPLTLRSKVGDYTKILDWGTDVGGSWGTMQISMTAPYATELRSGAWNFAQGNVGIGTTSPDSILHVNGYRLRLGDGISDSKLWGTPGTGGNFLIGQSSSTGKIKFVSSADSDLMTILNGGNVGIGTTSPDVPLDVEGAIQASESGGDFIRMQTDGTNNIFDVNSGDYVFRTSGFTQRMRITSGGDVLVQATSTGGNGLSIRPNATAGTVQQIFNRASTTSDSYIFDFQNGGTTVGYIRYNNTTTTYATSSDYRLKEDLQDFAGLDMVSKIPVYDFKWKTDESRSYGVMAHELQEVLPDAVSGEKDAEEMQGVDYSKIVPLLVKAIQELKAEIELLKSK